jgi:hypothetical protein
VYANGDNYTGEFKGDFKDGKGKMSFISTQSVYEGELLNDKKVG